ncbi:hypothetical protein QO011_003802 [Labrys wisconsinensis]|uniref:Mutator family transposase n=1 Tax=Labrys wisconsinensis TaxID=425677 RepID=A0ABU0J935_9HYPH|nr:hypothetical protein [Labrys wisconsinensis]
MAISVRADGAKEVLGLWIEQNEGAKFWLRVLNELKNRGVEDILIAVVDGLKGFPEAIGAAYPSANAQRLSPRRSSRPASSTSCATAWNSPPGRIASPSRRR